MKFYLIDDEKIDYREGFIVTEEDVERDHYFDNYSGYYVVEVLEFNTIDEAKEYCQNYNNYTDKSNEELGCCGRGCTMSAFDYARWNGKCAYKGEFFENDDELE